MAFCSSCGGKLENGAKYCPYCGEKATAAEPKQTVTEEKKNTRTNEYAGTLIKCPSCGTELPSLTAICPSCGHEINSAKVSDSLQRFIAQIDDCDRRIANSSEKPKKGWSTWGTWKKIGWVILNIYFFCIPLLLYFIIPYIRINKSPALTTEEKHKATVIENYVFPNDRGSILEALLFIKTKVGFLADEKVNSTTSYWMRLWTKKAEQLHQKAEMLFPGDKIATDTYSKITADSNQLKKKMQIRIGVTVGLIVVAIIFMAVRGASDGSTGGIGSSKSEIPAIQELVTNEDEGIYTYSIRNYVGKNAASIGTQSGDYKVEEYGHGELRIVFVTEDGLLLSPNDEELLKQYSVVAQNISPGTQVAMVHQRNSSGKPYDSLVSYQSHDEIVLFVATVGDNSYSPNFTEPLSTMDRHTYYIREYIGRNAASFGEYSGENRIDCYGAAELIIEFTSEDGSYIETSDINALKEYVVVDQDIAANSELTIQYQKNSSGKEYDSLVQSQNPEVIYLTVRKLDESTIDKMAEIDVSASNTNNGNASSSNEETEELTIKYKVMSNGKAEITGYSGNGNHATIDSKIDGYEVVRIADGAFEGCETLVSVLFWAEIEEIGDSAFKGCTALTEISIPFETTSIGNHAFEGCTSLSSLVIWGDADIGDYAFAGCTALPEVSIGYDTKNVGAHAFDGCTSLTTATIWNDDTIIGKDAFANCPNLEGKAIRE